MPDPQLTVTDSASLPAADTAAAAPLTVTSSEPLSDATWAQFGKDVATGAIKGVGNTVFGLGKVVHDYTPIGRISDAIQPGAFDRKPPEIVPTNTAQKIGFTGEQIGEFFVPAGTAVKAGKAVNAIKDAALAYAQTGSPTQAGVTGALTAIIPGAATASKVSGALERSAHQTMADALRATKEWAKVESEKLAPEMLKRGVGGTLPQMRTLARESAAKAGKNLSAAYDAAAAAGETVPGSIIQGNIRVASESLHTATATGTRIAVPGNEAAITQLAALDDFVGKLKADIPVNQAAAIKQQFDDIVERAGLFGPKAMASASEKAQGWSFKKASDSFRDLLNTNPTIEALNDEASFWIKLRNVTDATKLRKVGQTGGLVRAGAATVGAGVGATTGDSYSERAVNSVLGGLAGQQFVRVVQSPYWMSKVSAPAKQMLADALASGSAGRISGALARITSSLPAQLRPSMAEQLAGQ